MADLFTPEITSTNAQPAIIDLGNGIFHIKRLAPSQLCLQQISEVTELAPFRQMMTPMGHTTQVSMSNCGPYGWVSDLSGYRYRATDPLTHKPWPNLPVEFLQIHKNACELTQLPTFTPDACLINRYHIGLAMGRHQDKDEKHKNWPIVSISLGLSAVFQIYPTQVNCAPINVLLEDGDVLILSGPARHYPHGVKPIKADLLQPKLLTRYNITLRRSQ
jgi:alkylated DNA repair protein (DNA oxidative demethylase)